MTAQVVVNQSIIRSRPRHWYWKFYATLLTKHGTIQ